MIMIRNYFLTAWRNMLKTKGYTALNVSGLAIGMAVALTIGLWVYDQYSFDRWMPDHERLYQVRRNFNSNGEILNFTTTSLKLADVLRTQVPEIEYVAETDGNQGHVLSIDDKKFSFQGMCTGGDFLKMFPYPLLEGNAQTALAETYSIVLTRHVAEALFGKEDPMGKTIRIDNQNNVVVKGVLEDIPYNTTLRFDYLLPFSYSDAVHHYYANGARSSFGNNGFAQYVKLKAGIPYPQVASKVAAIEHTEKENTNAMLSTVVLQPMANWHLYGNYVNGKEKGGFLDYVRMFTIIGVLVLLIACINFINLTTARSERRAKEVGVRKAIGSQRRDLIIQFLAESFLLTLVAAVLSLLLVQLALPSFNALTGTKVVIPVSDGSFWAIVLGCVVVTALIAGMRPAFLLSAFNPVKVLKGGGSAGRTGALPRKMLVVAQFTCSIALIIGTIIVYRQIQYAKDRPTGYSINRLMMTWMNDELRQNYTALKDEMIEKGIVSSVTTATSPATNIYWHSDIGQWPGKRGGETIEMGTILVSDDYFRTLGMDVAEGRDFGKVDTLNVIFNEMAIRRMRIKAPVGQVITWDTTRRIIGIVKNALMLSPFAPPDPTMFVYAPRRSGNVMMYRLSPSVKTADAIAALTALFSKYNPSYPYHFSFADKQYADKFSLEVLVGKLAGIFAALAIFISCLGLFGLAAYMAEQRTREIGIRKVLGASVGQVWMLLSKDFVVLVLVSCLIASPLAFYFLHGWLMKYDYRISIGAGVFVMAALMALVITVVTISFQAVRAAVASPVRALRGE